MGVGVRVVASDPPSGVLIGGAAGTGVPWSFVGGREDDDLLPLRGIERF
jgi:hypothetical protein